MYNLFLEFLDKSSQICMTTVSIHIGAACFTVLLYCLDSRKSGGGDLRADDGRSSLPDWEGRQITFGYVLCIVSVDEHISTTLSVCVFVSRLV